MCRGTALPTRVWPIAKIPLHRGGIDIWSNLVFIHHWVLLKKLSILSIDTWGENPFFHSTRSSKNSLGRLWRPWSGTSRPKPSREGGGRGGVGVKGLVPAPPPVVYAPPCVDRPAPFGCRCLTDGALRFTRGPALAPPLNNQTAAVATNRLVYAPPCVWTAKPSLRFVALHRRLALLDVGPAPAPP